MTRIFESDVEQFVIEFLQAQGFSYLSPEAQEGERLPASGAGKPNLGDVILKERLKNAIETLIKGMLNKRVLLDLIRQFIVYERSTVSTPLGRDKREGGVTQVTTIKKM
jgi:type I site-specific restriction-modification system R (restriction) subunit